jgi:hypothetical protein
MLTTLRDKTARDTKHICVAQRCGCAGIFLAKIKPVLSQFLEPGVFIHCCAVGTECEGVKRVLFWVTVLGQD